MDDMRSSLIHALENYRQHGYEIFYTTSSVLTVYTLSASLTATGLLTFTLWYDGQEENDSQEKGRSTATVDIPMSLSRVPYETLLDTLTRPELLRSLLSDQASSTRTELHEQATGGVRALLNHLSPSFFAQWNSDILATLCSATIAFYSFALQGTVAELPDIQEEDETNSESFP